ncbi:anti-sigma factor [Actinokineospora soli]|uniref:Anti-sigma factor n=1 Tax=Actinokineospora soli TaxID=1048753 RepID=A0ABW2TT10_9PSEU
MATRGELVELRVEAAQESLPLVRTMAGAVAMRSDYDIDAIADLKLVADEICTMLIHRAEPGARLCGRFTLLPGSLTFGVSVRVTDPAPIRPDTLTWRLLTALVDSVATTVNTGPGAPELSIEVQMTRRSGL